MMKQVGCNLCGSSNYKVVYKTYSGDIAIEEKSYSITDHSADAPLRIVKCQKCGLIYANPRPAARSLLSNYQKMVDRLYVEEEAGRRSSARMMLGALKKSKKGGRLLEIGCATGFLLDEARSAGWEVYGVELSSWAVEYARQTLRLENVFHGMLNDAGYHDNFFDAVIMKDTIEHLTDPKGTLAGIRRVLKPDGVICVNTPNIDSLLSRILKARWWGVKQSHLYYFNRHTLRMMLNAGGFVPIKTGSYARTFSLAYWAERLKNYNETLCKVFLFLIKHRIVKNNLLSINLGDQIEVYARKMRTLKYLDELERSPYAALASRAKTVAVLPAYNAERTLKKTVEDMPRDAVDEIILVDDASSDRTVKIARQLGLTAHVHKYNSGYGANQKTCYDKALLAGADIIVMIHPDYQYDPKVIPQLIAPIREGRADAVFGSRMMKGGALEGGMPLWKHNVNILLTAVANVVFGTFLTEYHSGFRAYSAKALKAIPYKLNNDGFVFDTEIIAQILLHNFRIEEIPIRTRYFDEASVIGLLPSIVYGLGILKILAAYLLHTRTFIKFKQFG